MNVVETSSLGKRYRRSWALRHCTLALPARRVVALVGPNGAGKTTLLHAIVGLATPTTGQLRVLGHLEAGSPEALRRVAFVAQDTPMHRHLSVASMIELTAALNDRFDASSASRRLEGLGIPLERRVDKLSGGQRAQLALGLALARDPELLVLDEPLAPLDPLARHELLAQVMAAVTEDGLSVIVSSHALGELERVADHLVVLSAGQVQLAGDVDQLIGSHSLWSGPSADGERIGELVPVVRAEVAGRLTRLLVRAPSHRVPPAGWEADPVSVDELVLAYLRQPGARALPGPHALVGAASSHPSS